MKIKQLPEFILGVHYRELSPQEGLNKKRWILLQDIEIVHTQSLTHRGETVYFKHLGRVWMTFKGYVAKIFKGYSWNGNSPKIHIPIFGWVGTPDHPKTRLASVTHDAYCQFEDTYHMPLNRKEIDAVFYDIMKLTNYLFRGLFHGAVRTFGEFFKRREEYDSEAHTELDFV
jgi:hypothetical protein